MSALPVVFIMGCTATGKTDAAAAIFDHYDAEIISVDSSLIYQGMDIGSAKPDDEFLNRYPHHLVDVCHPNHPWSVARFYDEATILIDQIMAKNKVPILVGGTHFYFSALENGLSNLPSANKEIRDQIAKQAEKNGWSKLHAQLTELDPQSADRIDSNDAQRIQRALEIVLESGKTVAEHNVERKPGIEHRVLKLALAHSDRSYLHQRIETRFDLMLQAGLEQETRELLRNGVDPDCVAMKMIGYRQMLEFISGEIGREEMRKKGIVATRQLAKRQLTWLRNQSNLIWWVDFGLKDKKFTPLIDFIGQIVR